MRKIKDEIDIEEIERFLIEIDRKKLSRASTGIIELDKTLGGGFIRGSLILVSGPPGSGKTTLALQFVFSSKSEKSLYITFTEPVEKIREFFKTYSFYDEERILSKDVIFLDFDILRSLLEEGAIRRFDVTLIQLLTDFIKKSNVRKVVIDSITSLKEYFDSRSDYREFLMKLSKLAFETKTVILMTSEVETKGPELIMKYDFESYVADVIILLSMEVSPVGVSRWLQVLKARGTMYSDVRRSFRITSDGIVFI